MRVVNVVDLMRLQPDTEHPHGLPDAEFDSIFTGDRPIVFAYHGYPWLIHRLTYRRLNHRNLHVRGYKEEGTTTTPFDMVMLNDLDRFHLAIDVIDCVPGLGAHTAGLRQELEDRRLRRCASRGSTARTIPRSAAGPGRTGINAGPTSLKRHLVDGNASRPVDEYARRGRRAPRGSRRLEVHRADARGTTRSSRPSELRPLARSTTSRR